MPENVMDYIGQPVPTRARLAGLAWLTEELELSVTEAATLVDVVADALEADHPDEALNRGRLKLDETGAYRLIATMLAEIARVDG